MSPRLRALIEAARLRPVSAEERQAQRISLVYGDEHIENPNVTREMVERAVREVDAARAVQACEEADVAGMLD